MSVKSSKSVASQINAKAAKGVKPAAKVQGVRFVFDAARPSAGSLLASYTHAWLELSGLSTGAMLPAKQVRAIMGDTGFGYHTRAGNLEKTDKGVRLTEQGFAHFSRQTPNRNINAQPEMIEAYKGIMSTGNPDKSVSVPAQCIKAIDA